MGNQRWVRFFVGSLGSVYFVVCPCCDCCLVVCVLYVQSSLSFPSCRVILCSLCGRGSGIVVWFRFIYFLFFICGLFFVRNYIINCLILFSCGVNFWFGSVFVYLYVLGKFCILVVVMFG